MCLTTWPLPIVALDLLARFGVSTKIPPFGRRSSLLSQTVEANESPPWFGPVENTNNRLDFSVSVSVRQISLRFVRAGAILFQAA